MRKRLLTQLGSLLSRRRKFLIPIPLKTQNWDRRVGRIPAKLIHLNLYAEREATYCPNW